MESWLTTTERPLAHHGLGTGAGERQSDAFTHQRDEPREAGPMTERGAQECPNGRVAMNCRSWSATASGRSSGM